MDAPELKLVRPRGGPSRRRKERRAALGLGLAALGAAVIATAGGADDARRRFDPIETGREAFVRMLEHGSDDPQVRRTKIDLRRHLGERPLDTRTRAIYAWLLLETSGGLDASAACFHASRAASLNPVTVPVVRSAAHVLFRCGERQEALSLVREMFGYDAEAAARQVATMEPFLAAPLAPGDTRGALPENPHAYLAWVNRLEQLGRGDETGAWLEYSRRQWPDHLPTLTILSEKAARRGDWIELAGLLPPDAELSRTRESARLFALRSRLRAESGDPAGARDDAFTALELARTRTSVVLDAGDGLLVAGHTAEAKRVWAGALFELDGPRGQSPMRLALLLRLARIEDVEGTPATALRAWRAVLEEKPDQDEALRRMEALTGFAP
jgi:hypothetical protein